MRCQSTPLTEQPESQTLAGDSAKASKGLSRRLMLAGLAILPAGAVATPTAAGTDAELIALGKKFEILVDAYYAARAVWAPALNAAHIESDALIDEADRATPHWELPAETRAKMSAAFEAACERHGADEAGEKLDAIAQELSPVANAILALPAASLDGLRAKAMVAFREVAPLACGDTEYCFDNEVAFQRLFDAVAQVCGLTGKVAATGFVFPWPAIDPDYDGEEA